MNDQACCLNMSVGFLLLTAIVFDFYGTFTNFWCYGSSEEVTRHFGLIASCESRLNNTLTCTTFPLYEDVFANVIRICCLGVDAFAIVVDFAEIILFLIWSTKDFQAYIFKVICGIFDVISGMLLLIGAAIYGFNANVIISAEHVYDTNVHLSNSFWSIIGSGAASMFVGFIIICSQGALMRKKNKIAPKDDTKRIDTNHHDVKNADKPGVPKKDDHKKGKKTPKHNKEKRNEARMPIGGW